MGRGLSPGHILHPTDVAKLGVCAARTQGGGILEPVQAVYGFFKAFVTGFSNKCMHILAKYSFNS